MTRTAPDIKTAGSIRERPTSILLSRIVRAGIGSDLGIHHCFPSMDMEEEVVLPIISIRDRRKGTKFPKENGNVSDSPPLMVRYPSSLSIPVNASITAIATIRIYPIKVFRT